MCKTKERGWREREKKKFCVCEGEYVCKREGECAGVGVGVCKRERERESVCV